jgi:hypothetical protein
MLIDSGASFRGGYQYPYRSNKDFAVIVIRNSSAMPAANRTAWLTNTEL